MLSVQHNVQQSINLIGKWEANTSFFSIYQSEDSSAL